MSTRQRVSDSADRLLPKTTPFEGRGEARGVRKIQQETVVDVENVEIVLELLHGWSGARRAGDRLDGLYFHDYFGAIVKG